MAEHGYEVQALLL